MTQRRYLHGCPNGVTGMVFGHIHNANMNKYANFSSTSPYEVHLLCKTARVNSIATSKLRSTDDKNGYNKSQPLHTNMSRPIRLRDIEESQKLNPALVELLVEIVEILPNLEV
jgi:hypothetical protein